MRRIVAPASTRGLRRTNPSLTANLPVACGAAGEIVIDDAVHVGTGQVEFLRELVVQSSSPLHAGRRDQDSIDTDTSSRGYPDRTPCTDGSRRSELLVQMQQAREPRLETATKARPWVAAEALVPVAPE